jgi:hypothetical protein
MWWAGRLASSHSFSAPATIHNPHNEKKSPFVTLREKKKKKITEEDGKSAQHYLGSAKNAYSRVRDKTEIPDGFDKALR